MAMMIFTSIYSVVDGYFVSNFAGDILENCVVYGRIILCALPFLVPHFLTQSFFVAAELMAVVLTAVFLKAKRKRYHY